MPYLSLDIWALTAVKPKHLDMGVLLQSDYLATLQC